MDVDAQLNTHARLKDEAVEEELTETNTKAIERIKSGSNKFVFMTTWRKRRWCLAKKPAQAIFDMG